MDCLTCKDTGRYSMLMNCGECDGTGETECCECGRDKTCDRCKGTGKVREEFDCDCPAGATSETPSVLRYLERTAR